MPDHLSNEDAYRELAAYTLSHGDSGFVHQHFVDAWFAQHASGAESP